MASRNRTRARTSVTAAPAERADSQEAALRRMSRIFRRASHGDDGPSSEAAEMRANRRFRKRGAGPDGGGPTLGFASGRPRDPLWYWQQNNLPFEFDDPAQMEKLRLYCRLVYAAHPIVGSCVDIYSKYPVLGSKLSCKDERLTDFYTELFFNEESGLNYDKFLVDMGREYWTVGEAWPLGTFSEPLGVWTNEELINPDSVDVRQSPFHTDPRFLIRLPKAMRELIRTRQPQWEYEKLIRAYPELLYYADDNMRMPVSNILLRQLKFEADTFNDRGVPLLYRAMRPLMQEEQLNAAVDAIADRLYTPLLLAKLGASATDLGTPVPWIPTMDDLADFEEAVDSALAADFRIIMTHFGVDMEAVLGKEDMPDFAPEFDRLEGRILQTFGLSKTMLAGASSGETYAADALNRDLVTQMLTSYQQMLKRHYRKRALVVAEAQEHFDYDERSGKRFVKMEEIFEVDEETGEERIVEQPKLLIPNLEFKTMNLQDEAAQTEFFEALREAGVPVSMRTRLHNVPIELDDEVEKSRDEAVQLAVAEQETRRAIYLELRNRGLPIPADLRADFEPRALPEGQDPAMDMLRTPELGLDPTGAQPTLSPTMQDLAVPPAGGVPQPGVPADPVDAGQGAGDADPVGARPQESDEQRGGMPKPAALAAGTRRMRTLARLHAPEPLEHPEGSTPDQWEPPQPYGDPVHVGMRRYHPESKVIVLE
ncbi:hypothetical protein ACFZAM_32110 [Streptomyces sp. NPDC008079]|uniref:hypothetical protein n=1 Tax=Streptomyces sp. NPDC008079 TaxID=3364806 RepID=UPI0036EAC7F4